MHRINISHTPLSLDKPIPYQVIRSRRKTTAIEVHPDGRVVVRCPLRTSRRDIELVVAAKGDWIRLKQDELARQAQRFPKKQRFVDGEVFYFLGEAYPVKIVERQAQALVLNGTFCLRRSDMPRAAEIFEAWYKAQARRIFEARVAEISRLNGFRPTRLRLSSARTRWGSCSAKGSISLTWRLVMTPLMIIDYVIVHELSHLVEHNHSSRFWVRVETIVPDYRARRAWLKANAQKLEWTF